MPTPRGLFLYPILIRFFKFLLSKIVRFVDALCPRCRPFLQDLPHFAQQLIINLILGLSIAIIIMLLHNSRWMIEFEDMNVDWLMSFYRGSAPNPDKPTYPFVWINIDEQTYHDWHYPLLTPRDKLQQLLHFAISGQAAVIMVDIDLSHPRDRAKQKLAALSEPDLQLYRYLNDYEVKYCKDTCPHIIFMRSFRKPLKDDKSYYPVQHPTFLDKIVAKSPHLHWASVQFDREKDRVLRRWRLWEKACVNEQPNIVPSVPLLTLALITNSKQGFYNLNKQLKHFLPYDCSKTSPKGVAEVEQHQYLMISNRQLHSQPSRLNRRIFYTIPWGLNDGEQRPNVSDDRFLLDEISALAILKQPNADGSALLHNSITVIGGSYVESRDLYATPIGWMPGALVLINAIHSILQYGELNAPADWVLLLVITCVIVLMSFLLTYFDSFWGMTLSGLGIILIIMPISFWFFEYGIWLNFAIPLLIVQWRQMAADYEEAIKKCTNISVK
ncbi:MAG: CHASE2 domain-containing protein [Candidatus Parabeggiatoa sp.]|nr:CHASE2 domain-containing protein [Candidatus Parabeggiatoa sp.]